MTLRDLIGPLIVLFEKDLYISLQLKREREEKGRKGEKEGTEGEGEGAGEGEKEGEEEKKSGGYFSAKLKSKAKLIDSALVSSPSLSKSSSKILKMGKTLSLSLSRRIFTFSF